MINLFQVSWVRLRDINLLAINEVTNTKDQRIKAIHVPESDRWSLRIQDTQLSDDGPYECQVASQLSHVVHLKVLGIKTLDCFLKTSTLLKTEKRIQLCTFLVLNICSGKLFFGILLQKSNLRFDALCQGNNKNYKLEVQQPRRKDFLQLVKVP